MKSRQLYFAFFCRIFFWCTFYSSLGGLKISLGLKTSFNHLFLALLSRLKIQPRAEKHHVFFLQFLASKDHHVAQEKRQDKTIIRNPVITGRVIKTLQYNLAIPVILHGYVENFEISLSKKTPQQRTPQLDNRGSEGFQSRCFQQTLKN